MRSYREEWAAQWAAFRAMSLAGKIDHIYTYFKLPIIVGLALLFFVGSTIYRQLTKKDVLLYTGIVNLSVGEDLMEQLGSGFVTAVGGDPKRAEVYFYNGLYATNDPSAEDHEYWYASRLKMMAAIEAKQFDIVLMNREAYDVLSGNGYLLCLDGVFTDEDALCEFIRPYLTANTVILEDNSTELALGEAHWYEAVTEEVVNGVDLSHFALIEQAGFTDPVYFGVIANCAHRWETRQYLEYLAGLPVTPHSGDCGLD